ncbi:PREDICTED: E3 ubiquitin-protein ligase Topors-like [Cyprinodon variegatus]|uniref:E3 ubiquitin-protein ligase Topors n=1 Tax=Cyprinodon variegatus TaxID=28743 RepID=A0A3Q2EHL3_CYPVA|nr:PREDICTED: E3 ubiquitin-protein ligase Topors [Cyprinodon variegatus]XP_015247694.1 PREDICTED: E3 ubiquitin-protein ligase Topors-like [Cyprinodon variegatus]
MSAIKVALQQSPKGRRSKTAKTMSAEVSPDSKCPICLDAFHNMSYLDRCLHKFCFRCILEWSKNKPECPLCKQPFSSIYHSIKSDQDFQKYELKQQVDNSSFGYFEGVRFRYRTTLTGVHRQMRRTSPPPDNGVMFEASANFQQQRQDRYIRRMMSRLAAKRRAASEGRAVNNVREQEMINFRRELYRRGVRVQNVRDGGRSRDTSAEFYRRNPACLHRLVPWLKRELMVLYGAHGSLVNIVQHIIMSRITRYDMEDGAIQGELRPFLQGRTEHFLHEFINFARSPFNMEAYDQHAVYDCPAPSSNEHSSSNSSVIAISEEEESSADVEPPGIAASALGQSLWDDETPGPSYSTAAETSRPQLGSVLELDSESSSEEEPLELNVSPQEITSHSPVNVACAERTDNGCTSPDSDDCVIVGYIKPAAERTPELVHLSSDSDDSSIEETKDAPIQSQHIRFTSCSPAASHRSDSSRAKNVQTDHRHRSSSKDRPKSKVHKHSRTDKRFEERERATERRKSKEKEHKRKKSNSKSRGSKHSRSPVISHGSFGSHSSSGHFSNSDRVHAERDSYQSYTHYRHERNGSVTHYTQRRSYYYSSRTYSPSESRSRSRDSSQRRHRRRPRSGSQSSRSPSPDRRSHHDKPGGKRKCKAKHLEEPPKKDQNLSNESDSVSVTKHKKKSKERHHKKPKDRSRKRSGSRELDSERHRHHHKKKKKHKKKSKKSKSTERKSKSSTNVITIESDSESIANQGVSPVSRTTENPSDCAAADDRVNLTPADHSLQSH